MDFRTGHQRSRSGLVALLPAALAVLVLGLAPVIAAQPQAQEASGGRKTEQPSAAQADRRLPPSELKSWSQIEAAGCRKLYRNPWALLLFLPGPLVFLGFGLFPRRKRALAVLQLLLLLGAAGEEARRLAGEAERQFASGRYAAALALYRQAQELLPCNPALSYNLALCYNRLGERGYAIHFLRRSLQADPRDTGARRLLSRLEGAYGLEGQVLAPSAFDPDAAFLLTALFFNSSFVLGVPLRSRRRVRLLILVVLLAAAAVSSLGAFLGLLQRASRPVGVVALAEVELKKVPEPDSRAHYTLPPGTSLVVLGEAADYYLVETGSKLKGWVERRNSNSKFG